MRVAVFFFLAAASLFEVSEGQAPAPVFCYGEESCNEESAVWPAICHSGRAQSPIDLPTPTPLALRELESILRMGRNQVSREISYDPAAYASDNFTISDNGHSIQVTLGPTKGTPAISGYEMKERYIFGQMHFHWGSKDDAATGSEHEVGGQRRRMEVHLVHYKESYGSVAAAAAASDKDNNALAVVGSFLDVNALSAYVETNAMRPILENMNTTYDPKGVQVNKRIDISSFMTRPGEWVWRYNGSLTTPGCNEAVLWTMNEQIRYISVMDLTKMREVKGEENEELKHNNRKTQALNGRKIEFFKRK